MMIDLGTTIIHGLLICIPFTIFVAISFIGSPRLWLHSLPKDIQQMASVKTPRENRITRFVLLPVFLLILPGLSVVSTISIAAGSSFYAILIHLYVIWIIVHLWDLVIIDGTAMVLIDPSRPPIKGTENAAGWKDYRFHVRSFAEAVVKSAIFVVPASALIYFFS